MAEGMDLGKQVGPLPLGVWLAVGAAGLGIGYLINRNAAKKADAAPVQVTESGVGTGGSGFDVVNPPPPVEQAEETNVTWARNAIQWLIGQRNDPGLSQNAITKFINSRNLNVFEQALVNQALIKFGPPPEPLAPVDLPELPETPTVSVPGAVTGLQVASASPTSVDLTWSPVPGATKYRIRTEEPAGPTARIPDRSSMDTRHTVAPLGLNVGYTFYVAAQNSAGTGPEAAVQARTGTLPGVGFARSHVIAPGETLSTIAARYYGSGSSAEVSKLYAANRGALDAAARNNGQQSSQNGFLVFPGTVIHIP